MILRLCAFPWARDYLITKLPSDLVLLGPRSIFSSIWPKIKSLGSAPEVCVKDWERKEITIKERAIFHIACSDSARAASESVELVCEATGTSVNFKAHPLERIARDVKVIRQHVTVASHHIEDGGRVLLGLPPNGIMLKS